MPAVFDMPEGVAEALGGSPIAEELRGDLAVAHARAEAAAAAGEQDDAGRLGRAIVDVIAGRPARALGELSLLRRDAEDPALSLRALAYETLAGQLTFNAWPDGGSAYAVEIRARFDPLVAQGTLDAAERAIRADGPANPPPDALVAGRILGVLGPMRSTLAAIRRNHNASSGVVDALLTGIAMHLDELRTTAPAGWSAFADLATADLHHRVGDATRRDASLAAADTGYAAIGDHVGEALCAIARGDHLCAPVGSPLALDFVLNESASESSDLTWSAERDERRTAGRDLTAARAAYDSAAVALAHEDAPRACAALELRRGFLCGLAGDWTAAGAGAEAAHEGSARAGDDQLAMLARTHAALAAIGRGSLTEDIALVGAVGRWGRGDGSFSYAIGLGLLCGRAGRHWLVRERDPERALACHRLAAAIHAALGTDVNLHQSIVDQGKVHAAIGDATSAVVLYERAMDASERARATRPEVADALTWRLRWTALACHTLIVGSREPEPIERSAARQRRQSTMPAGSPTGYDDDPRVVAQMDAAVSALEADNVAQAHVLVPLYRRSSSATAVRTAPPRRRSAKPSHAPAPRRAPSAIGSRP